MTEYSKTIKELYALQKFSIKMGLENITSICDFLNNPQNSYPIIHIAGTNGKGSTSRMIQAILSQHGLKVGLYTSPHLMDFRERITIDGSQIEQDFITAYWKKIRPTIRRLKATFFDTTTALAFEYFKTKKVEIAVIETGLGGRLDSTNIVNPVAVVITPIEIDHIKQLGNKLKSIAFEKSSIIKKNATVFFAEQKRPVRDILAKAASESSAFFRLPKSVRISGVQYGLKDQTFNLEDKERDICFKNLFLNLAGEYQNQNAALAYLVSRWYLEKLGIHFSEEQFRQSFKEVTWRGRLQMISESPLIYYDVSHNFSGFKHTLAFADQLTGRYEQSYLLLGLLKDKAYKPIVRRIHKSFRNITVTQPNHEHALPLNILRDEFNKYGIKVRTNRNIRRAYISIVKNLKPNDILFVMGSHYIVGDLLDFSNENT